MIPARIEVSTSWEVAKILLPALIAGLGAWIGGKLSVSREMEKLKRERAFDQRLDWYCRAGRAIVQNQWFLIHFSKAFSAGDKVRMDKLANEREVNKVALEGNMREMVLFASPATIAALNRANIRAAKALKDTSLGIEAAQPAINELNQAYFVLANDVREHLGMERLTVQDLNATGAE